MKFTAIAFCCVILAASNLQAATMIGPSGVTETFGSLPPNTSWSAISQGGAAADFGGANPGSNTVRTATPAEVAALKASAQLLAYSTTGLGTDTTPSGWVSAAQNVRMQSGGNAYTVLMAAFQNNIGVPANKVQVSYSFGDNNAAGASIEQIPGWMGFYSLTGAAGTWIDITDFDGAPGTKTTELNLGSWPQASPIYFMWVDDNANGGTDGSYTLDNFTISATALAVPEPASVAIWAVAGLAMSVFGLVCHRRRQAIRNV